MRTSFATGLRLAAVALSVLGLACVEGRDRPDLTGLSTGAVPTPEARIVEVSPEASPYIAGRAVRVVLEGTEENGLLRTLGYEVLRGPRSEVFLSDEQSFSATAEREVEVSFVLPANLPDNTRLLLRAIAGAEGGRRAVSSEHELIVVQCPPNATWCN